MKGKNKMELLAKYVDMGKKSKARSGYAMTSNIRDVDE